MSSGQPPVPAPNAAVDGGKPAIGDAVSATSPKQNPAFKMMGLPRFRLPSRNWLIFLSLTGSFATAVIYDKWETKRNREKWCTLVSHLAQEPLSTKTMPRKLTIYLSAPPGDGLRAAREHFHDYVKPVLVAAAMDWDVVEGRKEGDVRFKTAERIRRQRRRAGEGDQPSDEEQSDRSYTIRGIREKNGTEEFAGIAGDIVIGRHTWKEYVRGLHEGWLGPLRNPQDQLEVRPENPARSPEIPVDASRPSAQDTVTHGAVAKSSTLDADQNTSEIHTEANLSSSDQLQGSQSATENSEGTSQVEVEEKPKPRNPPSYINPLEYGHALLSPNTPDIIGPSAAVRFPHLLGFRNTPIRFYRFLTRRRLANDVGRQVAMAILASHRSFDSVTPSSEQIQGTDSTELVPEQCQVLAFEERDWWKTTYTPRKDHEESVWIEDVYLDARIADRMQAFQLTAVAGDKAGSVATSSPGGAEELS